MTDEIIDKDYAIALASAMELFFTESPKGKITKTDFFNTKKEILKYKSEESEPASYIG